MCTLSAHICTLSIFTFFNKSNPLTHGYIIWFLASKTTEDKSLKACVFAEENENSNMKKFAGRITQHILMKLKKEVSVHGWLIN